MATPTTAPVLTPLLAGLTGAVALPLVVPVALLLVAAVAPDPAGLPVELYRLMYLDPPQSWPKLPEHAWLHDS
jgi:hypothetical protein